MSRKAQAKTPEREIKALYKDIEAEFSQWNFLKEHGGSDPFYADGVNMNLVRNHIIYDYRKLDELEQVPVQPRGARWIYGPKRMDFEDGEAADETI